MTYLNKSLDTLGRHINNDIYYFSPETHSLDDLPNDNWICLAIANQDFDKSFFEQFVVFSADRGLLEFKGQGKFGELLHDYFDEVILEYEFQKDIETDIMTTWYNDKRNDLANSLWDCFHAHILPDDTDFTKTKIVCISFDTNNYKIALIDIISRLNEGWIPPDE